MIRVLANKVLAFPNPNGEKDAKGNLIKVKTKVGYCPLPDWVEADPYYKMAVADGSIKSFNASSNDEETLKLQEKREALRKEIALLEEKRNHMANPNISVEPGKDVLGTLEEKRDAVAADDEAIGKTTDKESIVAPEHEPKKK